jgi:hypothetical protein
VSAPQHIEGGAEEIEEQVTAMDDKDIFEYALQLNNERTEKSTMDVYNEVKSAQHATQAQMEDMKKETERLRAELKEVKEAVLQLHQLLLAHKKA